MGTRLAKVLPDIVSANQSAFIKGRDIVDNNLICQDLALGFPRKLINWVMECVTSPWLTLSLNGANFGYFQDDLLLFSRGDKNSVIVILRAFATFSVASGLKMNCDKSEIYSNGMCEEEVSYILSISGFKEGQIPFRIFIIPVTVLDRIERICRNYLWEGLDQYHKAPPVAWDNVCKDKKHGGLGIINCRKWNVAMIGKYVKDLLIAGFNNGVWQSGQGIYSVSSGYQWLQGVQHKVPWVPLIWNRYNVPKHSIIGWLAIHKRLMTKDRLLRFGVISDAKCDMCLDQHEDHQHLLYECAFSVQCWTSLQDWVGIKLPRSGILEWRLKWWCRSLMRKQMVLSAILGLVYHVWYAHNIYRLEQRLPRPSVLIAMVKEDIQARRNSM
ncbi:uncharacterized protein LOC141620341 [Silene latifolia]|uniref:uncharacterized protein LOC141620341 n=1 Tax=Silene latifolia TaxID=37657 RepID=UPI003D77C354